MATYIYKKHLLLAKLQQINLKGLHKYLQHQQIHQQASAVKVIHQWISTNAFQCQQNRKKETTCQQCAHQHINSHITSHGTEIDRIPSPFKQTQIPLPFHNTTTTKTTTMVINTKT
jgi:hypothetical protein